MRHKVATGLLLLILVLSIFFGTSVFAANEVAGKAVPEDLGVAYRGHVQNQGNMPKPEGSLVSGPEALGTRGQSLRVEGFWIELTGNVPEGADIVYEVHVQNEGWMTPVKNGNFAGTAGESQRVESIKIRLENLPGYDVYYRGHVQNVGDIPMVNGDWGWKKNGEELGTTGSSLRLEELQVKLVKQPDTSTTYDKAGTYGPRTGVEVIENDVVINTPDVILQNLHIKGNLTIGEGVGEGDVTLNNITVDGETYIRGGGKNSIHINGGDYNKITIQQTSSGQVRIVATDAAGLEVVVSEDAKGEDIILEGAFENVQIDAPDVKISTQGETTIKEMVVGESSTGSEITLDKDTTVNTIDLNASVDMKGEGTIEKANVNSDDVTFEQKPVEEVVAPEVKVPPVVTPPEPPKPDPTPSNPPAEDQIVKTFNQQKSTDMMVNLLEVYASDFDLTGFNNLDYLGRLIVGDYLLKKDGFANRSVLQAAITEGIKLAKDDPEARKYIEAATAFSPAISFQNNNSLLLDYSNPLLSGTQKSLLNGLYADFLVCLEAPLADGEAFEITVSGTTRRITNKEMSGREILLSKLMGRTLGSADLVENQKARLMFTVKDISIKAEQYLTLYPCTTRNGDEYCRNFSNAHSIRVTRYWIEDFANGFSMYYKDSKFLLNFGKTYTAAVKQQLDTCSADLALQLYRPLELGESITVTVNGVDYPINANTVMDNDNKTGIRLSKLMGSAPTKASELSGELVIGLKSYQLNTPNGIDASAVLCNQDGEIFYTLSGTGTSLYPDWLKAYMDSVSFSSEEENKMTLDYAGNLSQAVCDHLGDYRADVIINFSRELDEGETLTITAFEKTKSFTRGEIAALGENGSQLRLSKLMGVDASLAKSEVGKDEITFTPSGLNRNIYIYSQAVLVKEDEYIYLDGLSNSLSLFEASFQAYADSIDLKSQENTFTVTYTGNLAADVKSKLTGYYADAMIYIDRPLKDGEEICVSAFGKDIPVTRATFNNVWGTWIRLSDLLQLELSTEQLAVNQKGSFEIKVNENSLSQQLSISASAILVKGNDIEYINKSSGMSLLPKGFEAFDDSVVLNVAEDNKFVVQYNGGLLKDVQDSLAGLYADPLIYIHRELESDESITIKAYNKEAIITRNTMKQYPDGKMGLTDLLDISPDNSLLAASKTGEVFVEIIDCKLNNRNDISIWKGLVKADGTWVYRANEGISFDLNPDFFEAFNNNVNLTKEDNKFLFTFGNQLNETDKASLNHFYFDPSISLSRALEDGETLTVKVLNTLMPIDSSTITEYEKTFIRLSQLGNFTLGPNQLAGNQTGSLAIEVVDENLKSDLTIYADALLVRDDMFYGLNKQESTLLTSQSFEQAVAAYTNGLTVEANEQSFKVTYTGNLSETDKTGLNGYYADAQISLSRPLEPDEEVTVQAFGQNLTVDRSAFADESGQAIYLSDLLDLVLGTDQLAEKQKGSFEIAVIDKNLKSELCAFATPVLRKGVDTRFIYEKQANITLGSANNPIISNGPFVGDATVVLKDGSEQNLDGTTGIFFLERYDVIDYLIFEMVNDQNDLPVPQKVVLSENPVLKISVDGVLCDYGNVEYVDETHTKVKITPSSEAMAKLDKLGYFAFNVPEGAITDEAGNPVRSMVGDYLSGTLATPLIKVTDSVKPFSEAITAVVDGNPVNASKNEITGAFELEVSQNSITSEIRVKMNEPVTVSSGANILIPGTETAYGEIKTDENDSSVVVIMPASTGIGTAGKLGLITFVIPENIVCDLVDNDSSNILFPSSINFTGGGLGNEATSFNLNVVER